MPQYTVTWVVDEEADTPEDAARRARARLLDPESIADIFTVAHYDGSPIGDLNEDAVDIDLSALDGRYVEYCARPGCELLFGHDGECAPR